MAITPTPIDSKVRTKARDLINTYGKTATLQWSQKNQFNVDTGEVENLGVSQQTVKVSPPEPYSKRYRISADLVKEGDAMVLISPIGLNATPERGMKLTIDDDEFSIAGVNPILSGEQTTAYELLLRL
jgi:hypothetical protein